MHGLVDGTLCTDVSGGSQAQTAYKSSAQIRNDISVQVRHDHNIELPRVVGYLHANSVDLFLPVLDVRVFFCYFTCDFDEKTITHLHDTRLVTSHYSFAVYN